MAEVNWKVSKDGKTVTAGGKTYSLSAFKKQFAGAEQISGNGFSKQIAGPGMFEPGSKGTASPRIGAGAVKQVSAKTADEAKASADKKSAKKAASSLKAASKPSTSSSADAARAAAAKRATTTAPSSRTAAQNIAISRTTGGIAGKGARAVNPVYRMMGGAGGGLGMPENR